MDVELEEEKVGLRDTIAAFVSAQPWADPDGNERIGNTRTLLKELGDAGWLSPSLPAHLGGRERDTLDGVVALEEIVRANVAAGSCLFDSVLRCGRAINLLGGSHQQARWSAPLARGEAVGAWCVERPGQSRWRSVPSAEIVGSGWIVKDAEVLCGGGNLADFFIVAVEGASGQHGTGDSLFLLESHQPGLLVEPSTPWNPNAYQATLVTMRNVVLTENHLLGELGGGSSYLSRAENRDRVLIAAIFLGVARGALDRLVSHANRHRQSENPSRASQAVRRVIADLHVKVDLARLLTYRAGWMEAAGETSPAASSMAEICATDACQAVSMAGTRLLGADMHVPEYTVLQYQPERFATAIGIGPHLLERDIIAKEFLL